MADDFDELPVAAKVTEFAPSGDFTSDPWVGVFPGLGAVSVAADGEMAVSIEPSDGTKQPILAQRERALYWGWAEPLALVRRGYRLIDGIVVGPPDETECLVILGEYNESARQALRLLASGWALLADRPSPHRLEDGVITAYPREAPMLVARGRALAENIEHESIRTDSDAVSIEVERLTEPRTVAALVWASVRRPREVTLEVLTGQAKFRLVTNLFVTGPSDQTTTPESADATAAGATPIEEHLSLAKNPVLRLRRTSGDEDASIDEIIEWWRQRKEIS